MRVLADTIKELTRQHLRDKKGRLYAQCVRAVGWIGNTVPDVEGIVELPTSDVSNGGVVVGASLAGERPIYVVRYQGFLWYNLTTIVNYAAKSLEMWDQDCPVLIRALAMEGSMGPVASNAHHSLAMRLPGIKVFAPMNANEWSDAYHTFMKGSVPVLISEYRPSFPTAIKFQNIIRPNPDITIFLVGGARLRADELAKCGRINIIHISQLKPLVIPQGGWESLARSYRGIVVDSDYVTCGVGEHIANVLNTLGKPITVRGLKDKTAGFSVDNITPSVEEILR